MPNKTLSAHHPTTADSNRRRVMKCIHYSQQTLHGRNFFFIFTTQAIAYIV